MDSILSVQNHNFSGNRKELTKFLEPMRKPKVIHTNNSWAFGKACEDLSWIIVRPLTDQKQMVLLRERYAGLKKGLLLYCCNQVWMKDGGRVSWSVTGIFETYKISCLIGKTLQPAIRRTIQRTSNPFVRWSISPFFCQRLVATASVRQESLTRNILRLCIVRGRNLERRHFGRRHWGIGKRWTHQKSMPGDSMLRKC